MEKSSFLSKLTNAACLGWIYYKINYSRSALGMFWPILAPFLFVFVLGTLFSVVMGGDFRTFLPHVAWGYAIWGFIAASLNTSSNLLIAQKNNLLAGGKSLFDVILQRLFFNGYDLGFQSICAIIFTVFVYRYISVNILYALPALAMLFLHGIWFKAVFSIISAKYGDVAEVLPTVARIGFLATPVIWMADSERGEALGIYLAFNPFYHVLEPLRRGFLSQPPLWDSFLISFGFLVVGSLTARWLYRKQARAALTWV